jgi:hypothetical protein
MKKNMGPVDRLIRVILAVAMVALYSMGVLEGTGGVILIALSIILVLTSLVGFCPLYLPLGLSTLRKKIHKKV